MTSVSSAIIAKHMRIRTALAEVMSNLAFATVSILEVDDDISNHRNILTYFERDDRRERTQVPQS
jgi:hypothetical protein